MGRTISMIVSWVAYEYRRCPFMMAAPVSSIVGSSPCIAAKAALNAAFALRASARSCSSNSAFSFSTSTFGSRRKRSHCESATDDSSGAGIMGHSAFGAMRLSASRKVATSAHGMSKVCPCTLRTMRCSTSKPFMAVSVVCVSVAACLRRFHAAFIERLMAFFSAAVFGRRGIISPLVPVRCRSCKEYSSRFHSEGAVARNDDRSRPLALVPVVARLLAGAPRACRLERVCHHQRAYRNGRNASDSWDDLISHPLYHALMAGKRFIPGGVPLHVVSVAAAEDHRFKQQRRAIAERMVQTEKDGGHIDTFADGRACHDTVIVGGLEPASPRLEVIAWHRTM